MSASVNIALPALGAELSLGAVALGWVSTSYLLASAVFLVPLGRLADIVGRKRIFTLGLVLHSLFAAASALAASGPVLIGFRLLQGMGAAMIYSTALAILSSVFPAGRRGLALGLVTASTYLGLSLGPVLGGLLTQQLGWRSIFWANVPLGLAAIAAVLWKLRGEWAEARGEAFDSVGSLLLGISLPALMLGVSRLPGWPGLLLIGLSGAGLAAFILWESRSANPILDLGLFRGNRVFALSNLAALINYSATFAVGFLLSLYLQYIRSLSPQSAGLLLVWQPVVMAVLSPLAGRWSDRIEARIIASAGMALVAAGLGLLAFLSRDTSDAFIIFSLVILGIGFGLFSSPNTNSVMSAVERRFYGTASATLATMRVIGQMLSMGIAILVFALVIGPVQITPSRYDAFLRGVRVAFTVFALLCLGGTFVSLARRRSRR
jgi:EmrB/QacA subfamily drug resistance transporter